jgi:hypothetical protein
MVMEEMITFMERIMMMMMMMMIIMIIMMMMMKSSSSSSRNLIPGGQDLWAMLHDAKISTTDIYGERRDDDLLVGNMGEAKVQTGMLMEVVMVEK